MEALREVTVWDVEYRQPNHIYLFDGSKVVAYIKWGEGEPSDFNRPGKWDKRGRKFVKADMNLFDKLMNNLYNINPADITIVEDPTVMIDNEEDVEDYSLEDGNFDEEENYEEETPQPPPTPTDVKIIKLK